MLRGNNIF